MIIGRDTAHLGPSAVRATNITCSSAVISWLPANSNHQHVVCVNNVEVRTVKPGVYRHTITGLAPSTQYRVTVRAKHLRAPGQAPPPGPPPEEAPGAYTDFRTLAKGLPDPPQDIQVEAGPQDGTLLVTWQPVNRPPSSGPVTGYAVYADGKKVTDVDSPTGDHALIDIGKLVGLNPRAVTVRTKSRDSQSSDSAPTPIPNVVRNAARNRHNVAHSSIPPHMRSQQRTQMAPMQMQGGPMQNQGQGPMSGQMQGQQQQMPGQMQGQMSGQMQGQMQGQIPGQMQGQMQGQLQGQMQGQMPLNAQQQPQQIIEHEENLSDKEVFPNQMHQQQMVSNQPRNGSVGSIPAIEITKDGGGPPEDCQFVSDELEYANMNRRRNAPANSSQHQQTHHQQQQQQQQGYQPNAAPRSINDRSRQANPANPNQPYYGPGGPQQQVRNPNQRGQMQQRGPLTQQQQQQKKPRYFVAMFDYDPSTMSPNPDGCEEELPFQEGDTIKVYGDKDPDGFYWGELRGRRGYVPHNMVTEIDETGAQGGPSGTTTQSVRGLSRDRWGDIYANMPVKRMIALYDYDPQELSPNVDAEQVELSFKTGEVILVYGDMDEDGFYMGELDGVRGLVPSNFLAEAPEQYNNQMGPGGPQAAQRNLNNRTRPQGPGARGPAPPSTSNMMPGAMNQRGQPRKGKSNS
ncbi:unnamed protein product [Hermetia illucens]|uniref:RIMS-binding protein 2 n=1 Tax=Hermetia illucens TaxID=343691 RepID=A0A7R8V5B0_HERIL|nr:unnamed protein product [Hermetia illucens]